MAFLPTSMRTLSSSVRLFNTHSSPLHLPRVSAHKSVVPVPRSAFRPKELSLVGEKKNLGSCRAKASMAAATTAENKKKVEVFDTEEDLAVSLAKYTADLSDKFCKERGAFSVVLSGGSLIKSLRKLLEPPYIDRIEWSKWHVFWVDERVVPKDHEDSNYKLAYDGFLSKIPILPGNVYAINDALSAEGAADDYETCLKHLVNTNVINLSAASGFPKFDLMLLGMGPDGHVASLFPGHPLLKENEKWVTSIKESPKPPPERITFTFPVINSSAYIALVVAGAGKAEAVQTALGEGQNSDKLPVQEVSPEGELTWFLDKGAASKL
ncbi:6-phosphogluconolactonase 3, chloroplastic-like [Juglans microcarpa x Juglans regia]|uniref:6-phosphogluconolactonase 3, chloroplastic-like n=1 Tax=Juglans microcarpa x Juglans regia TaxID=2249226 RepID=UPI001B7EDD70|nr:6-phosphogluconolactonase 3, chloroplastic-like [Juglans microcarpa x Juglans regia]